MAYNATPEVIQSVKREIERRKLSVAQVAQIMKDEGYPMGETTIRRVLRKDSEVNDHFRYETTIQPFWIVFMRTGEQVDDAATKTRLEDLEVLIAMKNEAIADLRERLAAMEMSHGEKCKDCEKRCTDCAAKQGRWEEQIRIKDQRIDRKDKQLDDQHEEILRLQAQNDRLIDIVLSRLENITK